MKCPQCGAKLHLAPVPVEHDDHWHRRWVCLCGVDAIDAIEIPKEY